MAAIDRSGAAESVTGTLLAEKIRTSRVSGQCGHPRAYCLIYHRCSFTLYVMCFHFQWAAVVPTTGARKLGTDFQRQRCLPCRVFELHRLMSRCCSFLAFFLRAHSFLTYASPNTSHSQILVVGAGGIGCELLKNLALAGFLDIVLVRSGGHRTQRYVKYRHVKSIA